MYCTYCNFDYRMIQTQLTMVEIVCVCVYLHNKLRINNVTSTARAKSDHIAYEIGYCHKTNINVTLKTVLAFWLSK